jgi:hypothetical protein
MRTRNYVCFYAVAFVLGLLPGFEFGSVQFMCIIGAFNIECYQFI